MPVQLTLTDAAATLANPPPLFWVQMETATSVRLSFGGSTRDYPTDGYREAMAKATACSLRMAQASAGPSPGSQAPPAAPAGVMDLTCIGVATYPVSQTTNATIFAPGGTASGFATTSARGSSQEQLSVRIENGQAKVRPPRVLVPPMRGKGAGDGWWPLSDFQVTPDRMAGSFSFNVVNKPKVNIDRRSGEIDLSGFGISFRGRCEATRYDATSRRF